MSDEQVDEQVEEQGDKMSLLFLYAEEPVHCGVGQGVGAIDQPIQREEHTGFPMVYGSSLRGALRARVRERDEKQKEDAVSWLFGNEAGEQPMWQGALSPHDARIVLFPVQSLFGGFAWITCRSALAVLHRNLAMCEATPSWQVPPPRADGECLTPANCTVAYPKEGDSRVAVLRDHTFKMEVDENVGSIAKELAGTAMPDADEHEEYKFWRERLLKSLVVLSDADFGFFVKTGTQVITRVKLTEQKTVDGGMLWTEEALPPETLLHAPVAARKGSKPKLKDSDGDDNKNETKLAGDIMEIATDNIKGRIYLGGTESIGRGRVMLRWLEKGTTE